MLCFFFNIFYLPPFSVCYENLMRSNFASWLPWCLITSNRVVIFVFHHHDYIDVNKNILLVITYAV